MKTCKYCDRAPTYRLTADGKFAGLMVDEGSCKFHVVRVSAHVMAEAHMRAGDGGWTMTVERVEHEEVFRG
jgi:hypothetical protein